MRASILVALALASPAARAQGSAGGASDTAAILRAIEALRSDMKADSKATNARIDRLEKDRAATRQGRLPPPSAPQKSSQPAGQSVPGWFVRLKPWTPERDRDEVAGFPGPMFDFNFDLHSRYFSDQNRYIYHGISFFHVKEDGLYSFSVRLEPVAVSINQYFASHYNCSTEFRVNDNVVLRGITGFGEIVSPPKDHYRSQTFSSQLQRLTPEPGKGYKLEFMSDCWSERNKTADWYDSLLAGWKKNQFKIMVKTPADTLPRPFRNDELYYVGQPS